MFIFETFYLKKSNSFLNALIFLAIQSHLIYLNNLNKKFIMQCLQTHRLFFKTTKYH